MLIDFIIFGFKFVQLSMIGSIYFINLGFIVYFELFIEVYFLTLFALSANTKYLVCELIVLF